MYKVVEVLKFNQSKNYNLHSATDDLSL